VKKEIKHGKNTMITKNHYLTRYFEDISRKKAGKLLLGKEKIKEPLTPINALEIRKVQITDSNLRKCHDEEAIHKKNHLMLKKYQDEFIKEYY